MIKCEFRSTKNDKKILFRLNFNQNSIQNLLEEILKLQERTSSSNDKKWYQNVNWKYWIFLFVGIPIFFVVVSMTMK